MFENVSAEMLGNIYVGLLGLSVLLYAILDGYDLGVGVLIPPRTEALEIGRQPYLVSGVLRTADAVTQLPPANIALSFTLYLVIYTVLLIAYMGTLMLMCRRAVEIEEITTEEREIAKAKMQPTDPDPSTV